MYHNYAPYRTSAPCHQCEEKQAIINDCNFQITDLENQNFNIENTLKLNSILEHQIDELMKNNKAAISNRGYVTICLLLAPSLILAYIITHNFSNFQIATACIISTAILIHETIIAIKIGCNNAMP